VAAVSQKVGPISTRERQGYLVTRPNRFACVFTPQNGSWPNLLDVSFAKLRKVFLRHLRVQFQVEWVARLEQYLMEINEHPVPFRWQYQLDELHLLERSVIWEGLYLVQG
jgi:hypothetical protein